MKESVAWDVKVLHIKGRLQEVSCGPAIDQDVSTWNSQQAGLMSGSFEGSDIADLEKRISFFHDDLNRYLARGES